MIDAGRWEKRERDSWTNFNVCVTAFGPWIDAGEKWMFLTLESVKIAAFKQTLNMKREREKEKDSVNKMKSWIMKCMWKWRRNHKACVNVHVSLTRNSCCWNIRKLLSLRWIACVPWYFRTKFKCRTTRKGKWMRQKSVPLFFLPVPFFLL